MISVCDVIIQCDKSVKTAATAYIQIHIYLQLESSHSLRSETPQIVMYLLQNRQFNQDI